MTSKYCCCQPTSLPSSLVRCSHILHHSSSLICKKKKKKRKFWLVNSVGLITQIDRKRRLFTSSSPSESAELFRACQTFNNLTRMSDPLASIVLQPLAWHKRYGRSEPLSNWKWGNEKKKNSNEMVSRILAALFGIRECRNVSLSY